MLEIDRVSWKNFGSYGNYLSEIDLSRLGQCLIVGEVIDDSGEEFTEKRKSNGSGKSTLVNVIQWVLFGRTMHSANPGNNVVNWHTGQDCVGKIEFKNGDTITRTRNVDGKNELLFYKDGDETRLVSDTLATTKIQQAKLAQTFGLDWELFCGSVFFSQYNKPWFEMADQARKKALERALHVDRLTYYAKSAKDKSEGIASKVHSTRIITETLEREINRVQAEKTRLLQEKETFATRQQTRIVEIQQQIQREEAALAKIELPDLEKLEQSWKTINDLTTKIGHIATKVNDINTKRSGLNDTAMRLRGNLQPLQRQKAAWLADSGTTCQRCQQVIDATHATSHAGVHDAEIAAIEQQIAELTQQIAELTQNIAEHDAIVQRAKQVVQTKTPTMSLREAKGIHANHKMQADKIVGLQNRIVEIQNELNPYDKLIADNEELFTNCSKNLEYKKNLLTEYDYTMRHYNYVFKAYHDRTKIKSCIFKDHVPYINSRLHYYLDVLGLDIKISLTDTLGVQSNLWGYDFESGGERKRTDVAMMLAMFDFHDLMYGRQANFIVLDEVDGRLDDDGVEGLINIIKNDIATKVESTLIISHKTNMFDVFPRQITVRRTNRFSQICDIT